MIQRHSEYSFASSPGSSTGLGPRIITNNKTPSSSSGMQAVSGPGASPPAMTTISSPTLVPTDSRHSPSITCTSQGSSWPGERDASLRDVASANQRADPVILSGFKKTLMVSGDAAGTEQLLHASLTGLLPGRLPKNCTFPLALLTQFPTLPADYRAASQYQTFFKHCQGHVFFKHLPTPSMTTEAVVPPLRFGIACLASVCSGDADPGDAERFYTAGSRIWVVMMEVDNSLARSVEMLLSCVLLLPYGVLCNSRSQVAMATMHLCSCLTISRRMRLHIPGQLIDPVLRQRTTTYSSMVWLLWLWDIIGALHLNLSLNFSSKEAQLPMPSSTLDFYDVYQSILQDSSSDEQVLLFTMPKDIQEQAVLLLVAVLSDSITLRRSLGSASNVVSVANITDYRHNPFMPFAAHTELERIQNHLIRGLDRWHNHYETTMSPEVMAFYHYCVLYLSCPAMPHLSQLAQYEPCTSNMNLPDSLATSDAATISEKSVNQAWALLDAVASRPKNENRLCPAWLPVVLFHAALVVWASIRLAPGQNQDKSGSVRALLVFKVELESMHWPCCPTMAETLRRLMSN